MSDFSLASSLIWVGDSKTNFEESYGPVSKIHARRDAISDFSLRPYLGLATARQTFETFCTAVLMSLIQGVEMSTRCQICRSVDKWNGRFCLSLNSGRTVQYKHNAQFCVSSVFTVM